jgi:hypothetical protein
VKYRRAKVLREPSIKSIFDRLAVVRDHNFSQQRRLPSNCYAELRIERSRGYSDYCPCWPVSRLPESACIARITSIKKGAGTRGSKSMLS